MTLGWVFYRMGNSTEAARAIQTAVNAGQIGPEAAYMAARIAEELDLVGLLAVEMFVTKDDGLLVNEIAPRPHNSGHWTQDGCATSQFEQFVRGFGEKRLSGEKIG